jgi:hypothetical protein
MLQASTAAERDIFAIGLPDDGGERAENGAKGWARHRRRLRERFRTRPKGEAMKSRQTTVLRVPPMKSATSSRSFSRNRVLNGQKMVRKGGLDTAGGCASDSGLARRGRP